MITTKNILDIDKFDPTNQDITYIQNTINEIPEDGIIDINQAERLATIFLRAADYCGDLIAKATRYYGSKDTQKKAQKSESIYRKIKEKVTPTVAKDAYADDTEYVDAANDATTAEALLKWLEKKHSNLISAHILCKSLLSRHSETERSNSWKGGMGSVSEDQNESLSDDVDLDSTESVSSKKMKPGFVEL